MALVTLISELADDLSTVTVTGCQKRSLPSETVIYNLSSPVGKTLILLQLVLVGICGKYEEDPRRAASGPAGKLSLHMRSISLHSRQSVLGSTTRSY